jgi:hypothetical protein
MRTICGSSLLSTAINGVRERMIASKSRNGLSVRNAPDWLDLVVGEFMASYKTGWIVAGFKKKRWRRDFLESIGSNISHI